MKNFPYLRSFLTWLILLVAMGAFTAGLKEGVDDVQSAAFFPVAGFAVTLGYILGFGRWTPRRAWIILLVFGVGAAVIETAKLIEPFKNLAHSIPPFELELIRWLFAKDTPEIPFPDTSMLRLQLAELAGRLNVFFNLLFNGSIKHPSTREFLWDLPLLVCSAWAGWKTSRHNQSFLALAPALILHTYVLDYTRRDLFSLQIALFALLMLVGVNQKWNIGVESKGVSKAVTETYSAILILSIVLATGAGFMPSISIAETAKKLTQKNDDLGKALGLEKEAVQAHVITGTAGLPRQHLIGLSPSLAKTIMFTVSTGEIAPVENLVTNEMIPRHYWRWLTYDVYNGQGWSTSAVESVSHPANGFIPPTDGGRYKIIHQQVEKIFSEDRRLYWTGQLMTVNQPLDVNWRVPISAVDMFGAVTQAKRYSADSMVLVVSANELRASPSAPPAGIREMYLTLPDSVPQRVRGLAQSLTENITNPYDMAKAIEKYLRAYPYSLDVSPPPPDRDVADYFLFDLKRGYCDYYATSMVVLARSVGLPARLVIGYANGMYNAREARYTVRESDAHSWVEIYFTGIGWVEFEPTAGRLEITYPDDLPQEVDSSTAPLPLETIHRQNDFEKHGYFPEQNVFIPLAALISVVSLAWLWFLRAQGLLRSHKTIGSIYRYIFYHGKRIYKGSPLNETPTIFAGKLRARLRSGYEWLAPAPDEIGFLTDLYIRETYSAHPVSRDERVQAVKVWRKLFWRLLYARTKKL